MLDFLAAEYVVDLIIHFHCSRQIVGMNLFFFPCSYMGSFVLKSCVTDDKAVDCAEIGEMLSTIISNTTTKTSNATVTGMLFDLFSYLGVPVPSQKYKRLVFKLIENSTDIVVETLEYRNIISDKLTSWCVHVNDADNVFRV